ncbi:tRNA (adenosine(37)-N6)-dimethylallyltransferase MiaA [Candidatus Giovannonibacteria bacterium]|nr:tRNA (adenosine(37)-N6)-dimethylallyltransferase MiaA [Candidatus Giovannonibacteria bacterium]
MKNQVVAIVGPTASGKSDYAVRLAKKIGGEIISCDSRQVYKELTIGTAKISPMEMKGIPHHCINLTSVKKVFTVMDFMKCADGSITSILSRGKVPILVGGTGFYMQSLLDGLIFPQVPPNLKLRRKLEKESAEKLYQILQKKDPARARTIERKNKRRLIRALEIIEALGKVPELGRDPKLSKYNVKYIGIKRNAEDLSKRIEQRTKKMLDRGLIRETKKLRDIGLTWKRIYELGFEYKYPALYLQKKISKKEMIESINRESIKYVRRQMLWWKKDKRIKWLVRV